MALSKNAKRNYRKAKKAKDKKQGKHWLFVTENDSKKEAASKVFTQVALVVLIFCLIILGNELRLYINTVTLNHSLQELVSSFSDVLHKEGELSPHAKSLLELNEDTVGWIEISDTNISLPVVQRKTADGNEYYLKTAFDGSNNKAGTIFIDYRATLTDKERSDNITIYGHNQRDKTMFGELANYKKSLEYYSKHPTINFSSNYTSDIYKIVGYFVAPAEAWQSSTGKIFDYHNYIDFNEEHSYDEFIKNVLDRSQINTTVDVNENDEFITLSTCSNEFEPSRFVVVARKVRENEDAFVDTANATLNEDAVTPEYDFIYNQ